MLWVNLLTLCLAGGITWWLTGFDKSHTGEHKRQRYGERLLRTGVVMLFVWFMLAATQSGDTLLIVASLIIFPILIAVVLRSAVSEILAGGFLGLLDPATHDTKPSDLLRAQRHRDNLSYLIHHGHREQAIKLCEELKLSGELDAASLANTLEFLGVKQNLDKYELPMNQVARLRAEGNHPAAIKLLHELILRKPPEPGAALALVRLYAEDYRDRALAEKTLADLLKRRRIPPEHYHFALNSLTEWCTPPPPRPAGPPPPPTPRKSLSELIADRQFGTAIEQLEKQVLAEPDNFTLRQQLAEMHALQCHNLPRAEKVLRQAEAEKRFSPEQLAAAYEQLKEWRKS